MNRKITVCLFLVFLLFIFSCQQPSRVLTAAENNSTDIFKNEIHTYTKSKVNSPDYFKTVSITEKVLVTDTTLIKNCFYNKYASKEINFDKPSAFKSPLAKNISEKFYKVLHSFEAKNSAGAIKSYNLLIYLDSSENIIYSFSF
jgi:hypothetical protein